MEPPRLSPAALLIGLEQAKEGFALTDAEGLFTYMNRQHLTMFGFTDQSEVLGRSWSILYEDAVAKTIIAEVMPLLMRDGSWSGHVMARRRDGQTFHEDLTLSLRPKGGIICNCRDRTKEIEMAERTARSEQLLRGFMEHVPSAVAIMDAAGRYLYVNPELCRVVGRLPESFLGRTINEVTTGRIASAINEAHEQVSRGAGTVFYDLKTDDGRVYAMITFALRDTSGAVECFCSIGCDETDRRTLETEKSRTLERQAELLTMQREFSALVSHEFNTPMATIRGATYMLRNLLKTAPNPKAARYLDLQEEALMSLIDMIKQVRELNQIEDETHELARKPVELSTLVIAALKPFIETAGSTRIGMELPSPATGTPLVMANECLLRSALSHLVSNAVKYSEKPIRVSVFAKEGDWCIQVRDEGRGVPQQDQKRLFESFFRAGNAGNISGVGLGLRIAQRTVELHDGRVTFTSTEGVGSTFSIHLPASAQP